MKALYEFDYSKHKCGWTKNIFIYQINRVTCAVLYTRLFLQKAASKVSYYKIKNIVTTLTVSASTILNAIITLPFTLGVLCAVNRIKQGFAINKKCTSSFLKIEKEEVHFCYLSML